MKRPDLVGDQLLQPPQIAVMDGEFLKVADGVVKILGAGTDMAAGTCQHPRYFLQRLSERSAFAGHTDPAAQRPHRPLRGAHRNPPDRADALVGRRYPSRAPSPG